MTVGQGGREAGRKPLASTEFCRRGKGMGWALQMGVVCARWEGILLS